MTHPRTMAVIANREGRNSLAVLSQLAGEWQSAGTEVVGLLAEENDAEGVCSAGFLRDIASGRAYSIQLDVPPVGTSCHLDATGVEHASAGLLDQIAAADVIILSKFGKLEVLRKGLWPAFAAALAAGKPLLTTVSPKHADALKEVVPEALWMEADRADVEEWWRTARPVSANASAV